MTTILAIYITPIRSNCDNGPVRRETNGLSWIIIRRFTVKIRTNLSPIARYVFVDSYMTTTKTIFIIKRCPNCYYRSIRWKAYRSTRLIIFILPINIISNLSPSTRYVFVDSYMTTTRTIAIIKRCPNCYYRSIRWKTYRSTRLIISTFTFNIISNLTPRPSLFFVDAYMATIWSVIIIAWRSYSDHRAIIWDVDWPPRVIINSFPINSRTNLSPTIIFVFEYPNMSRGCSIVTIAISTNGNYGAIWWKADWIPWRIESIFTLNITTNLCPLTIDSFINSYMTTVFTIVVIFYWSNR